MGSFILKWGDRVDLNFFYWQQCPGTDSVDPAGSGGEEADGLEGHRWLTPCWKNPLLCCYIPASAWFPSVSSMRNRCLSIQRHSEQVREWFWCTGQRDTEWKRVWLWNKATVYPLVCSESSCLIGIINNTKESYGFFVFIEGGPGLDRWGTQHSSNFFQKQNKTLGLVVQQRKTARPHIFQLNNSNSESKECHAGRMRATLQGFLHIFKTLMCSPR